MTEFYIETNSFAAPFFSDGGHRYVSAATPQEALEIAAREYKHPCGLYSAAAYTSADAMNKGEKPLAKWLCNAELKKQELTQSLPAYAMRGISPGVFEIDGVRHTVRNPKGGRVVGVSP